MPVNRKLLKNLALGLGVAGGSGYLGHKMGYHRGAKAMSTAIGNELSKSDIFEYGYNAAKEDMQKNSMLKIAEAAFNDEIEKLSGSIGKGLIAALKTGGAITHGVYKKITPRLSPKYIARSYQNFGKSMENLTDIYNRKKIPGKSADIEVSEFLKNLSKSKMALGTTAGTIALANKVFNKKPVSENPYIQPYYEYQSNK
jgi:hypothetical protein